MLEYNAAFVGKRDYEAFRVPRAGGPPRTRSVIVTCMDTRLTLLLPGALNIHDGDAKIIKNAGAVITHPFGGIVRSVMIALFELGADEVFVIGHHDCGMTKISSSDVVAKMESVGIARRTITTLQHAGIDVRAWLSGFDSVEASVENSVHVIRNHPLCPSHVPVHGLIIHPDTGKLDLVVDGYANMPAPDADGGGRKSPAGSPKDAARTRALDTL
jgi:carbonic anhydrase